MFVSTAINVSPVEADTEHFIHPLDRVELIRYFEQLRLAHGTVKLLGLPDVDERNDDLPLRALFVEPRVGPEQLGAREFDEETAAKATKPLLEALAQHRRLVLLGDPGAGKSTVINWLCTALAQPLENEVTGTLGRLVPLPFILRDLPLGVPLTWDSLLKQFLQRPIAAPFAKDRAILEQLLDSGQALILLDGIDEVGSIDRRKALREAVWEGWANSRCQWVLTSRAVGYSEVDFVGPFFKKLSKSVSGSVPLPKHPTNEFSKVVSKLGVSPLLQMANLGEVSLLSGFSDLCMGERLYIAPFTDAQVRQFIVNWFRLREPDPGLAGETAVNLIDALEADSGTKELARIPNLLTLIALIYRVRAKLPDGRAELYLQISQAYLKTIDEFRKLTDLPPYTFEEKMSWLARVGWEMQQSRAANRETGDGLVKFATQPQEYLATGNEVRGWFELAMQQRFGDQAGVEAERFLHYVQRRTGLLLERGEGRFAFLHLSFQEFFAGRHLASRVVTPSWTMANLAGTKKPPASDPTSAAALRSYCSSTLWQETLVFLMETLSLDWAQPVMEKLYPESNASPEKVRPKNYDYSLEGCARWLLAARLAGDPHVALPDEFRECLMRACWRWELARYSQGRIEYQFHDGNGVARQLLARRDTISVGWSTLRETFPEFADNIQLDLSGCTALSDLSPLSMLTGLQWLDLSHCTALSELSPLSKLTGLQSLRLSGCTELSDLGPLSKLTDLQSISLSGCTALSDLSPLGGLTKLHMLNLDGCAELSDLSPLGKLTGLQSLDISDSSELSDLSLFSTLTSLETLYISGSIQLSDLSPLEKLTGLKKFGLFGCAALSDLSPLEKLTSLEMLYLLGCTVLSDLSSLEKLGGLRMLYLLDCTELSDLSPLEKLTGIHSLTLSGSTVLSDLSPLAKLTRLFSLELTGNTALSDLSPLKKLTGLQWLNLSGCTSLGDLSPLKDLPNLQDLRLNERERFPEVITSLQERGVRVY
jgi:internalin A